MKNRFSAGMKTWCSRLAAAFLGFTCMTAAVEANAQAAANVSIPDAPREFRGAWIASVYNINWPSKPGLSSQEQQRELIVLLDRAQKLNMNAIILQVRPMGDALYASQLDPWSEYLTGVQGKAPEPYYDPLAFAVQEAHKRSMHLHAWINPYRVGSTKSKSAFANNAFIKRYPNVTRKLDALYWSDPAAKESQDHLVAVVADIVRRYDVDGIHIDDYFYPYKSEMKSSKNDFPDGPTYAAYQQTGGKLDRDHWRRQNVDTLMQRVYAQIKAIRPTVQFGIAPFGIWRPGHPAGISGMDAYNEIYGDAKKWYNEGWVDYMAPQLYWDLSKTKQSYPKLLTWWGSENTHKRHLWPGISISGVGNGFPASDVEQRIGINRKEPGVTGEIMWNIKPVMSNQGGIADTLAKLYSTPAVIPASPWLDRQPPAPVQPRINRTGQGTQVQWTPAQDRDVLHYVIYARINGSWQIAFAPVGSTAYNLPTGATPDVVAVSVVDKAGNESPKTTAQ